jgi:hypothetical protein
MASDTVFCGGCGITLRPFMKRCPRCGFVRADATEPRQPATRNGVETTQPSNGAATFHSPQAVPTAPIIPHLATKHTTVIPFEGVRRRALPHAEAVISPPPNTVFVSPRDRVRRFPLFNNAQLVLLGVSVGLLIFASLIAYLVWSGERREELRAAVAQPNVTPPPPAVVPSGAVVATPDLNLLPALPVPLNDQALAEEIKKALTAYNPTGFARYHFTVKEGVVTLTGEAAHQPEKEGVTNVVRLLAGVKKIVNNLVVKPELQAAPPPIAPLPTSASASLPAPARASVSLNSSAQPSLSAPPPQFGQTASEPPVSPVELEAQRLLQQQIEAARLRREQEDARQREAEEQARKQEAERQASAQQPRSESGGLRSGTVAWSGVVDGVDEIVISGSSASVRHVSGGAVSEARASFSAPIPRAPVSIKLVALSGRGSVQILQQPAAANGYTTIVRVDDSVNAGGRPHQFTLRWALQ